MVLILITNLALGYMSIRTHFKKSVHNYFKYIIIFIIYFECDEIFFLNLSVTNKQILKLVIQIRTNLFISRKFYSFLNNFLQYKLL